MEKSKKGLSDKELIAKYEAGKIHLGKAVKVMLETPSPTAVKSDNQTKKR